MRIMSAVGRRLDIVKQHATDVTATLNAEVTIQNMNNHEQSNNFSGKTVRAIPTGGRIQIISTAPISLGKVLPPLHWLDHKLDDFPDAIAKVATAAEALFSFSFLASVSVTPITQPNQLKKALQSIDSNHVKEMPFTRMFAPKSPIPCNARKRAVNFSAWIHGGKILMEGGSNVTADLQCGDIFHVFSLVCSGAVLVFPCLPDEGVGGATKLRRLKRRSEDTELYDVDRAEKLKSIAQDEFVSRQEKDFLSIMMKEMLEFRKNVSISSKSGESPQEAMASYKNLLSHPSDEGQGSHFHLELVKAVCTEIQKVGDQGSSIEDVYSLVRMPGEQAPEIFILALQEFGRDQIVYYSVMIKAADNLDQETYGMKLHGHTKLGEGKHKNQNHALVITRGEAFQTVDTIQDNCMK
ncbi:hypothetical protein Goklo_016784 [Gossypium klotzschianum]|uniref:Uncharacterized protein n=1 Tax=Gossypium klotzschianum TaxID=34286 RepID=A0A7J8UFI1_9ROSI|nr:hypothetical protein [Gossypium klotzschianum]